MVELQIPDIVNAYVLYCNYRNDGIKNNMLDLRACTWLYPTTLLPLGVFIKKFRGEYRPPFNHNVANYLALVIGNIKIEEVENKSYIPVISLPQERGKAEHILGYIYRLHRNGTEYGGENAFKYLIGELVDNMYDHAEFNNALVMAQRYDKKKFLEITFFDDGITIPGSFSKKGLKFSDSEALVQALNGLSAKSQERGYGLSSNLKILTRGLQGEMFIASGRGAIHITKNTPKLYKLQEEHRLEGTLISVRIPFPTPQVNIYEFIN